MQRSPDASTATSDKGIDVLIALIGEHWSEIHHIEEQRSALTNILLVLESGAVALAVDNKGAGASLLLSILLIAIGAIGILATRKYHERFRYAQERLTQWYQVVDRLCPEVALMENLRKANARHKSDARLLLFRKLHLRRVPLHSLWIWVHVVFVVAGVLLAAASFG